MGTPKTDVVERIRFKGHTSYSQYFLHLSVGGLRSMFPTFFSGHGLHVPMSRRVITIIARRVVVVRIEHTILWFPIRILHMRHLPCNSQNAENFSKLIHHTQNVRQPSAIDRFVHPESFNKSINLIYIYIWSPPPRTTRSMKTL